MIGLARNRLIAYLDERAPESPAAARLTATSARDIRQLTDVSWPQLA